jgi:hypothetical protein
MEQRYGPVGMIWLNASLANDLLVVIPSVAGFVTVSSGAGPQSH